jgi:hypothetical protein
MAKLTAAQRKRLPDSAFAVISQSTVRDKETGKMVSKKIRKFPVMDKGHASAAKAYLHTSDLTPTQKKAVVKKANKEMYGVATTDTAKARRTRKKK